MKRSSLGLMCCPKCHCGVSLQGESGSGEVEVGELVCEGCKKRFSVKDGIPRLIEPQDLQGLDRRFAGFYDWFSRLYPALTDLMFLFLGGARKGRKEVLDRLEPAGGRILEVSVGTGANLPYLLEYPGVKLYFFR